MFKYDYKYAILLDKLKNVGDFIFVWNRMRYIHGGRGIHVSPLPLDI